MTHKIEPMATENTWNKARLMKGFSLNGWQVKPLAGKLTNASDEIHLEPKIMDVLVCLACHQGEVVTRDVLLDEVWGRVIVSDDAVTRCISELRTILGDTEREERAYIRTIPRRGYSLIMPVVPDVMEDAFLPSGNTGITSEGTLPSLLPLPLVLARYVGVFVLAVISVLAFQYLRDDTVQSESGIGRAGNVEENIQLEILSAAEANEKPGTISAIAVLPFVSLGAEIENDFFAEGVSEDIRNSLMTTSDLRVAARTSSSVFKDRPMDVREIGAQLNVDALLEGTVRIDGNQLRITTQLTDARNGYSIWAATFEKNLEDKFQLQREIAQEIAKKLMPSLKTVSVEFRGTTANRAAQDYYFLGRHYWHQRTPESLEQAVNYFRQAISQDKNYALAWAGLSDALIFQTSYDDKPVEENNKLAGEAVTRALELEPELAEAHASYGIYLQHLDDPAGARLAYERSIELNPQNSMAHMWLGNIFVEDEHNVKQAHFHYREALKYDPLHPQVRYNYAMSLTGMGEYEEAIKRLEQYLKFNPHNMFLGSLMEANLATGNYDEVLNLAVGYNFGDDYKNHTLLTVVETLIELNRFEQAEKLIEMSHSSIELWEYGWIDSRLAMAKSDTVALVDAAKYFEKNESKFKHPFHVQCVGMTNVYLRGVASYLERDYKQALKFFEDFKDQGSNKGCRKMEIKLELIVLLYRAAAMLHLDADGPLPQQIMHTVDERLAEFRDKGWNTPMMAKVEIARYALSGENEKVAAVVDRMERSGWKPYGMINSSPILKEIVQSLDGYHESFSELSQDYASMQASCDKIVLAKIGL